MGEAGACLTWLQELRGPLGWEPAKAAGSNNVVSKATGVDKNDLEAAHHIPNRHTHPPADADGDGQPVRTEPTIIVRFY